MWSCAVLLSSLTHNSWWQAILGNATLLRVPQAEILISAQTLHLMKTRKGFICRGWALGNIRVTKVWQSSREAYVISAEVKERITSY